MRKLMRRMELKEKLKEAGAMTAAIGICLAGVGAAVAIPTALITGLNQDLGYEKKQFKGYTDSTTYVEQTEKREGGWLYLPYKRTEITRDGKTIVIDDTYCDGKLDRKADAVYVDIDGDGKIDKLVPGNEVEIPVYDQTGNVSGYTTVKIPRLTGYESQLSNINERIEKMREQARTERIEEIIK